MRIDAIQPSSTIHMTAVQKVRGYLRQKRGKDASVWLGVSLRQRALFYRQLHSLLRAGLPLGLALHHAAEGCHYPLRPLIERLAAHVGDGGQLAEQLAASPHLFPAWEVSVVRAAELSGALPEAMEDLARAVETEWDLRSRISTVTFPARITAMVAMLVGLIVGAFAKGVTDIDQVFSRLGYTFLVFAGLLLAWLGIKYLWQVFARSRRGAALLSLVLPAVPLIGPIQQGMARIRFVRTLGTLWRAGVAPLEALEVAAQTTGQQHFIRQVQAALQGMSKGEPISSVLRGNDFIPAETLHMLRTGETAGTVAEALDTVAEYLDIELAAKVQTLPAKLLLIYYLILVPIVFVLCLIAYLSAAGGG